MKVSSSLKRIMSCVLALTLVISIFNCLNVGLVISAASDAWDGTSDTEWLGSGTEADPYQISNASEFYGMILMGSEANNTTSDTHFKLTNDIYLNDITNYKNWENIAPANNWYNSSIMNDQAIFTGKIDGNYKTVYGLYLKNTVGSPTVGLIANIMSGSSVKNLTLSKSYISNTGYTAGIVGSTTTYYYDNRDDESVGFGGQQSTTSDSVPENIDHTSVVFSGIGVDESVIIESTSANYAAGGIVANLDYKVDISYSYSAAKLISASKTGGLYANAKSGNEDSSVSNCYSVGASPVPADKLPKTLNSVYTDAESINAQVVTLPAELMKGETAEDYMPNLGWNRFRTTTSYPIVSTEKAVSLDIWEGGVDTSWAGEGTKEQPYLISTPEELAGMIVYAAGGNTTNTTHFALTNDIYLNDIEDVELWGSTVTPANTWSTDEMRAGAFKGVFDGNHHTVHGVYYKNNQICGLIPVVSAGAIIKNVNLANSYMSSSVAVGGIVGTISAGSYYYGADVTNEGFTQVIGCGTEDTVRLNTSGQGCAGGVIGRMLRQTTVNNCYSLAQITAPTTAFKGGIYGGSWNADGQLADTLSAVTDCYSIGVYPEPTEKDIKYSNVYTDTAASHTPSANASAGITVLNTESMKGAAARASMPTLDWNLFATINGSYPRINGMAKSPYIWDGTAAVDFSGGDGLSPATAYQISTAEELYKMVCDQGKNTDGTKAYYVLTRDIYLNAIPNYTSWTTTAPKNNWYNATVWQSAEGFIGELDGNYKTVYGLYSFTSEATGLIPKMSKGAAVKNLKLSKAYVSSNTFAGGIVGASMVATGNELAVISGCGVDETVRVRSVTNSAGGIVGRVSIETDIDHCYSLTENLSGGEYAGGLIGDGWSGFNSSNVKNCYTVGKEPLGRNDGSVPIFSNIYTDKTPSAVNAAITQLETEVMMGESAKESMPNLGWSRFVTTDTYPVTSKLTNTSGAVWNGDVADSYVEGDGKSAFTAYQISTAEQLRKMITEHGANTDGTPAHYILVSDIYLNDVSNYESWATSAPANNWYVSANDSTQFVGNIDGNGHTIYGLYSSASTSSDTFGGLIQNAARDIDISNLHIRKSYISGKYAGSIVGSICGTTGTSGDRVNKLRITGSSADNTVTVNGATAAGGLIGYAQGSLVVENSYFSGNLTGGSSGKGGIYGYTVNYGKDGYSIGGYVISESTHLLLELRHVYSEKYYPVAYNGSSMLGNADKTLLSVFSIATEGTTPSNSNIKKINDHSAVGNENYDVFFEDSWYREGTGKWLLKNRGIMISDINGDDVLNATDLVLQKQMILDGAEATELSDINKDAATDLLDFVALKKKFASANGSEIVDSNAYELAWSDEFSTGGLDFSKWSYKYYMASKSDLTLTQTRDNADVVRDENGDSILRITAKKDSEGNFTTTNSITTGDRMTFQYGYLEIRAKVPTDAGVWPSFWLKSRLQDHNTQLEQGVYDSQLGRETGTAYDVEVDVFEGYESEIESNIIKWTDGTSNAIKTANRHTIADNEWHTYGILWTPEKIEILVDGNAYMSYNINDNSIFSDNSTSMKDIHQPLAIIFNHHVGTPLIRELYPFISSPAEDFTEVNYDIDYVRLYQKQDMSKIYTVTNR